jgi:DNA polymerase-3 subunit beta
VKFSCSQKNLSEALSIVQKAVPSTTPHPVLEGIYIETYLDVLKLRATDTEITIETHISADIEAHGFVIVPSKMFTDIVRKLPDTTINITVKDGRIRVEYHNSFVNINAIIGDYPELKDEETNDIFEFKQDEFKKMIQKTVFAASLSDHMRPEFTGVLLELKENRLTMVCVDGFRLALVRAEIKEQTHNLSDSEEDIIVPAKAMGELSKILGHAQESMDIRIGKNHIIFDLGNIRLTSILVPGKFIDYTQVVHDNYKLHTKIDKDLLYKSLDRATVFSRDDKNNLVEFKIKEDKLLLSSFSEYGDIHDEVPLILKGEELNIAFNSRYYMEALRVIEDSEIRIDFINSNTPCLIRPLSGKSYAYMILPVRTSY